MSESENTSPGDNPSSAPSGYLYHNQGRRPRTRREVTSKVTSGMTVTPRRHNRTNPVQQNLKNNVRLFVLVAVAMGAILFVSIKALQFAWSSKDRELARGSEPAPVAARDEVADAPGRMTSSLDVGARKANSIEVPKTELDTEAIRRAVYLSKRGEALERAGNRAEAILRYREALDIWPFLTQVWEQLGRLYLQDKDYYRAQVALENVVENNPGSPAILNDLGVTYLFQQKTDKARSLFEAATEIDPGYAPTYFNLALCALSANDRAKAADLLDQYLRLRPEDPRALRERAFLRAMGGGYAEALAELEKAITQSPDWPLLYFDAAAVSALMGKAETAIRYLEKAEPLSSPAAVYKLYQEPAFRDIRLSELGKLFEQDLAAKARDRMAEDAALAPAATDPILSTDHRRR